MAAVDCGHTLRDQLIGVTGWSNGGGESEFNNWVLPHELLQQHFMPGVPNGLSIKQLSPLIDPHLPKRPFNVCMPCTSQRDCGKQ